MNFEEWKRRFVVQESDLGDKVRRIAESVVSSNKVVSFDGLPKEYQRQFREGLVAATPEARAVLQREYRKTDYIVGTSKGSYHRSGLSGSVITIGTEATPSTLAHELFHKLDIGGRISKELFDSLMQDYVALNVVSGGDIVGYLLKRYPHAFVNDILGGKITMAPPYRGISDIIDGLSDKKVSLGYGHRKSYWENQGALEAEAWAQFGRIQYENDSEALKTFHELFPNFERDAIIALKELR